ncbi:MATE family efflux transporter [Chitinophaga sp. SYP-B3965]|uniref:MATE family efflux transporter n=1 Tax=Chitinophaga sp. SYP-B3965 TaxID=2663120 RepID=UPI00129990D8|nr:MATE family efflux transporter [Chitinophaga sp. SYP-B3965]MRG45619.1 MATE family efflux transporter [Chitinophaga sp. SYP-B3965]
MQVDVSNKQILKIAGPICLALILPQINHMTNAAFLGHLGEFPFAVNGIAGIYYLVMYMIAYGLNSGLQVLFARRAGELNYAGMGRYFSNGILLALLFSAIAIVITYALAPYFFAHSLHDPNIRDAATSFTRIRIWGLPFLMLMGLCNAFYTGTGNTRLLAITSLFQEAVNIGLDYGLIFGKMGLPALGLNGAAYASIIAEFVGFVVAFCLLLGFKFHIKFHLFTWLKPDWTSIRNILTISAPLIVQFLFSIGSWLIFFIFIEHLGQRPLAISNMMRSIFGLFGIFTWALASTCNTMVSNLIGQGRENEVVSVVKKIGGFALLCAMVVSLLINIFPYQLLHIYTADTAMITEALPSIHVCTLVTLLSSITAIVFNGVTGTGNTRINLFIEFAAVTVYLIYCFVVIERWQSPLHWAWGAEFVYWTTMFSLALWYLRSGRWKGKTIA